MNARKPKDESTDGQPEKIYRTMPGHWLPLSLGKRVRAPKEGTAAAAPKEETDG